MIFLNETETAIIKRIVSKVDGWLSDREGETLYKLARSCLLPDTVIVEIGSWQGKSTIWLSKGSKAGKNLKVYAIDPHPELPGNRGSKMRAFDQFKENISKAGVSDIITPLVQTSEDAAKGFSEPVGLIFIDGNHEYNMVKLDFELWFSKVKDGGIMAFHDTIGWSGPRTLVEEKLFKSSNFKRIRFVGSITYGHKCAETTCGEKLENISLLFVKRVYNIIYKVFSQKYHHAS